MILKVNFTIIEVILIKKILYILNLLMKYVFFGVTKILKDIIYIGMYLEPFEYSIMKVILYKKYKGLVQE